MRILGLCLVAFISNLVILVAAGKSKVIELTDSNFDRTVYNNKNGFLVEFFAPWISGIFKTILIAFFLLWTFDAAEELDGKVNLGALDATVHTVKSNQFGIRGFPTIKYFPPGSSSASDAIEYNGGRSKNDIVQWALAKAAENLPPPELKQATSKEVVKEACDDKQLCIIAFLPQLLDCQSKCRNQYINMLKDQISRFKKSPWGWLWAEGGEQPKLEEAFDIGGFGYPAMIAANSRKLKYSTMTGSFGKDGVGEFLRDLSYGRGKTSTIRGTEFPEAQDVKPWDGKDAEPPVMEEIDLSDVELEDLEDLKKTEL
ncbi:Protein disulfide-isomerase [Aphelenchoides besseyi]|nr:Protein disulfide-isomerase [Aphelenchoides besseyi]